jgi:DNA mismatch endonuclease, patch repair protein
VCARPLAGVPTKVDILFRPVKLAIEIRGCYWHGCPTHYKLPSTNTDHWAAKIARNVTRDAATEAALREAGWTLIVVWEHDDLIASAQEIGTVVRSRRLAQVALAVNALNNGCR